MNKKQLRKHVDILSSSRQTLQKNLHLKEAVAAKVGRTLEEIIPENQNAPFDMYEAIDALIDEGSFFDVKKLFAKEIITGLARIDGQPVGIIANQPKVKGGVSVRRFGRQSDEIHQFM